MRIRFLEEICCYVVYVIFRYLVWIVENVDDVYKDREIRIGEVEKVGGLEGWDFY